MKKKEEEEKEVVVVEVYVFAYTICFTSQVLVGATIHVLPASDRERVRDG